MVHSLRSGFRSKLHEDHTFDSLIYPCLCTKAPPTPHVHTHPPTHTHTHTAFLYYESVITIFLLLFQEIIVFISSILNKKNNPFIHHDNHKKQQSPRIINYRNYHYCHRNHLINNCHNPNSNRDNLNHNEQPQ